MAVWFDESESPFDLFLKTERAAGERRQPPRPRPSPPAPSPRPPPAHIFRHGDLVNFQHGHVIGQGKLVASSMSSVVVQTADGVEHRMAHEALLPPDAEI